MTPDVSVIIPVYNVEQYLERCIKSVIGQTLKNIEIIIVNDGSTDSSGKICDNFAKLDSRIKVIHKKNGGLSDARNAGLSIAKGKFIAFVDSDDYIHEDMYQILLKLIIANDCDIAESGYKEVFDNEVIDLENQAGFQKIYDRKRAMVSTIMDHHCRNYVWNKLYKRELWEDIRFPTGKIFEDVSTTYQVINKCSKIIKIDNILYYYYQRQNSIVNSNFSVKKLDHFEALEGMMEFIEKKYPDIAPVTCIKYYSECLSNFQNLLINRKEIEDSDNIIREITENLVNEKYYKYLKRDITVLCKQTLGGNYQIFLKQKFLIKLRLSLLRKSVWLLYLFNKFIGLMKSSAKKLMTQTSN